METGANLLLPQRPTPELLRVGGQPMADFQLMPYDNEITLLYKWAEIFQVPVNLIIVRPRTARDVGLTNGTQNYIFESLPMIVKRLSDEGEAPGAIYDIITRFKPNIRIHDIVMTYYNQLKLQDPNPDLYILINQIYREMDNNLIMDKFENRGDLQGEYDAWRTELDKEFENDMQRLESIKDVQFKLAEVDRQPKIQFSPVTINSTIAAYSPTINNRPVTLDDGLDIFNQAVTSRYIPYIRFNDKYGKTFSRVYTGGKIENEPNYSITVIPFSDASDRNTIYMSLWLGDPNNGNVELHDAPRESFFIVTYHLDRNYLTIKSPVGADPKKGLIRDEVLAYQRTRDALPNLVFGHGKEIKVGGEFDIWGMDFDETSFLDMVLIDPLMNVYLYVEENIRPFAFKKRLDVHYRSIFSDMGEGKTVTGQPFIANSASVSVTLTQRTTLADEIVEIMDPITKTASQAQLVTGTPYIHINISQAESRGTVEDFIPIFNLLMRYYLDNQEQILEIYNERIPELGALEPLLAQRKYRPAPEEPTILELTKKQPTARRADAKIKRLQEQAPGLFVSKYARVCQCPLQPIIIEPDEIEAWKQRRLPPFFQERQIMPFPKDNPQWNIVCPDDENPYPGVKRNWALPNNDTYPYVPCCFKSDQMTPGETSKYRDYVEDKPIDTKKGAIAEKKISTRKFLSPYKTAYLPRAVKNIVERYSDEHVDMVRYGVIHTPNSLLHCVCTAIDDPNYLVQTTPELKEIYVTRIRRYMLTSINPSLLKQELHDYSDEEIVNILSDNSKFFDPALFYRAVEETFNINIYVFTPPPPGDDTELGAMEVPRFKIFHARPLRLHRPTVVIIKTGTVKGKGGAESDALQFPQCELIVDYDKDNHQILKLFGPEMTEICHSTLQDTIKTLTWTVLPNNTFEVHSNIYYYIDHLNLFQYPAVSQFIDNNGKMRALTLNLGGTQLMTIATIPSQPENLPFNTDMNQIDPQIAIRIFGEPTSVSRDTLGNVNGLWFQIMDIVSGEYVPVIPGPGFDNKPVGPDNPILSNGTSVTGRLSKLRRTLNIIVQITRWLYDLARSKQNIDPSTFASLFMVMDQAPVQDSSNYYDLSNIQRRLPDVETVQEAIRLLEPLAPTLFNGGRLVMYSPTFADRVVKMLQDYINLEIPPSGDNHVKFIDKFYETEADFINIPNSKIFTNEKDLIGWMMSMKSSQNYSKFFTIKQTLDMSMGFTKTPYLYRDNDGKIYVIQNVVGGSKEKALSVAYTWDNHRVNIGHDPNPLDITPIDTMIYGISPASTLTPIEDETNGANTFLKLLYYGTRADKAYGKVAQYGAILEIL